MSQIWSRMPTIKNSQDGRNKYQTEERRLVLERFFEVTHRAMVWGRGQGTFFSSIY